MLSSSKENINETFNKSNEELEQEALAITLDNTKNEEIKKSKTVKYHELLSDFENSTTISKSRNNLAYILENELGLKHETEIKGLGVENIVNNLHILTEQNTYKKITEEELYNESLKILHGKNSITPEIKKCLNKKELKHSLDYIPAGYRTYDKVTLNNGIYSFKENKFIKGDEIEKAEITHKRTSYNYNPDAEGVKIKEYLRFSFDKFNPEFDPENPNIKGFFEICGYSLRSGNPEKIIGYFIGVADSGKSLAGNLLKALHDNNTSSVPLAKFNDIHSTAGLINKSLNLGRDIGNEIIEDNSTIKVASGNEPLLVNPKHKTHAELPVKEVPMTIEFGNTVPRFANLEPALINRILMLIWENRVPSLNNEDDKEIIAELEKRREQLKKSDPELQELPIPYLDPNLLNSILDDSDEMDYLLTQSLKHDKMRIEKESTFSNYKNNEEIEKNMIKYSDPIGYLLNKIVMYDSHREFDEGIYNNDLFDEIKKLAKSEHLEIPKNNTSLGRKIVNCLREEFDLRNDWKPKTKRQCLDRNNQIQDKNEPVKTYPNIKYNPMRKR